MNDFFPILRLKGDPYQVGLNHGRTLAGAIKENLGLYNRMVGGLNQMDPGQCLEHATRFVKPVAEYSPFLLREMEGIAAGAGMSLEEVMFLNARSEIMSMAPVRRAGAAECTAVGFSGERTVTGSPLLAQNWDWHQDVRPRCALFQVEPAEGPRALYLAEAGQVGKIGVNEAGVGVLLNILFSVEEVRYGIPVHVLLRQVLACGGTGEAVDLVRDAPRTGGSHFLVGDAHGQMTGLELTPSSMGRVGPEQGVIVHTNHYLVPGLVQMDAGPALFPDTISRFSRAKSILGGRQRWDVPGLARIFTDHDGGPSSICRHLNPSDPEFMRIVTIAGCVIDLQERSMMVSHGQPCKAPYRKITLE